MYSPRRNGGVAVVTCLAGEIPEIANSPHHPECGETVSFLLSISEKFPRWRRCMSVMVWKMVISCAWLHHHHLLRRLENRGL